MAGAGQEFVTTGFSRELSRADKTETKADELIIGLFWGTFCRLFLFVSVRAKDERKMNAVFKEETLGQRIRAQRMRLGMTQEELADALFVEKSLISYYENDRKEMKASGLVEVARALYTTPDYLLGFEEEKEPFEKEAFGMLQSIADESVRAVLLTQIKAVANM